MKIIINRSNGIQIDDELRTVDLSSLDADISSMSYDTLSNSGEIEYADLSVIKIGKVKFDSIFPQFIKIWRAAATPQIPEQPTIKEAIDAVRFALQSEIDSKAQAIGFSNGNALMLYAGFANAFQPVAEIFATWEASVWVEAENYKAQVLAGLKPMLSGEQAVAMMPDYPQ